MVRRKRANSNSSRRTATVAFRRKTQVRKSSRPFISLGALEGHLGYFIRRVQVWVFQDFIRTLGSLDISPAQFSVLVVVGANPGLSQSELAEKLDIERARLVRLLHNLGRRGLTQRLLSREDKRTHALRLTSKGRKVLTQARQLAAQHEARLIARLGVARHQLLMSSLRDF